MSNPCRSHRSVAAPRRFRPGMAVLALSLFTGLTPLSAGVSMNVVPSFPGTVTAAATGLAASFSFTNSSTGPDAAFSLLITSIALTPSCGHGGSVCVQPDPGVFALSATGTGQAGSACAGAVFTIGAPDAGGRSSFSPSPPVVLTPTGQPGSSCTVDFTFDVLKVPTIDASNPTPGVQTDPIAEVSGDTIGNPGTTNSGGSTELTVNRALPTLATNASADVTLGGQVTDTAQLSAGSNPGGGSVTFHLYGPNDATCAQPFIFVSTNTASAGGTATSNPFTPTSPGTYRWIAAYAGDANNLPVQGACNDANESVLVSLAPPLIAVSPASLESALLLGGTETLPLDIQNQGGTNLDWSVAEAAPAAAPCDTPVDLPWVSVSPTGGTTLAGATRIVDVTFDATGLARGVYPGVLCVHSNDLVTPVVEVPVTLSVAVVFLDGFETGDSSRWSFVAP